MLHKPRRLLQAAACCGRPSKAVRCNSGVVPVAKAKEEEKTYDILSHTLVSKHEVMSAEDVKAILTKFNITINQLPKIFTTDAAVKAIGAKEGDVIKISRASPTAGKTVYHRLVMKEL